MKNVPVMYEMGYLLRKKLCDTLGPYSNILKPSAPSPKVPTNLHPTQAVLNPRTQRLHEEPVNSLSLT